MHIDLASFLEALADFLASTPAMRTTLGLLALALSALLSQWLVFRVLPLLTQRLFAAFGARGWQTWNHALLARGVYRFLRYAAPFVVIALGAGLVPHLGAASGLLERVAHAAAWVCAFRALGSALDAWHDLYTASPLARTRSIKGYVQTARLMLSLICGVLVLSILIDRSPLWMISGLGALSAVLLLVFKDTLLSLVASTQLTSNDMLRIGDWIAMPQSDADGAVEDIALHTVKIRNWDNTVTTVPTYKLFSESYRNYRQMFESGARRIKRAVRIDAQSVRFLSDEDCARLMRFHLLHDYLQQKCGALREVNTALEQTGCDPVNHRRLTNLGTLRAYCMAYLRQHAQIRQDLTLMVRMLEPGAEGIPIEIYCFCARTPWIEYELVQGDIFDHLVAILPELDLRLYQAPAGYDLRRARRDAHTQRAA